MKQDPRELSERKKLILKAIVNAHIEGGEPVGSKYILESHQLSCSSATIRNEMAELEEMGYLEQPHTSSGRVPSELGYRFYVDSLIDSYAMTAREVMQINNLLKIKMGELDQILDTASKLASTLTNYTGIAIRPKAASASFERFETVYIDPHNLLLIMMNGTTLVKTQNIRCEEPVDPELVAALGRTLNENMAGYAAGEVTFSMMMQMETDMGGRQEPLHTALKVIYKVTGELDGGELKLSGLNRLLQYPEYSDSEQLGQLIGALESKDEILDLVGESAHMGDEDGVKVVLGSESSVKVMNQSAIVFKKIKKNGRTVGAVGIIGPLRMDYAKVLATIDSLGGNIANLLDEETKLQLPEGGNKDD